MPVAAPAPARAPQRRPEPRIRPEARPGHLRVVRPGERSRRRLTPATGVALTALLFVTLFALAIAHTMLVQGQMRLDQLDGELATEQARYQELRTEVAAVESPARVVAAAERLGMVSPEDLVYLQPRTPDPSTTPADGSADAGAVAGQGAELARPADGGWSSMKPLLGSGHP